MEFIGDYSKEQLSSWTSHFAQVKAAIKQPKRSHEVKVKLKSGGEYSYKYADLADVDSAVMSACRTVIDDKGNPVMSYMFDITNGEEGVEVNTLIIDSQGAIAKSNRVWFKNFNIGKAQETASLISYAKRYSLSGAFGIASDDDDDAQHNQTNQINPQEQINKMAEIAQNWRLYIDGKDAGAKKWIKAQNDPVVKGAIKRLLGDYEFQERLKKQKEDAVNRRKADGDAIKELVDGEESDSKKESKEEKITEKVEQDLFDGML